MTFATYVLAFAICVVALEAQPIASKYPGYKQGNPDAPLQLEAYLDLTCPDCATAWPGLKDTIAYYGPSKLYFIAHTFPLPYHHNAFFAARGLFAISKLAPTHVWDYVQNMFDQQTYIFNVPSRNMTATQVMEEVWSLTVKTLGVSKADWLTANFDTPAIDEAARVAWKFAAARDIYGTPQYQLNGVNIDANETWTLSDWRKLLDPLLANSEL